MRNNIFLYICIGCLLLSTTACRKYVEINQEGIRELEYTTDYQNLLYNTTNMDRSYTFPIYAADDFGTDTSSWQNTLSINFANAYTWAEKVYVAITDEDNDWRNLYSQMYICNSIISNVMGSKGGTDAQKHKAMAEAQVQRAYIYHTLINVYAKQYDAGTAGTDAGVPLRLNDEVAGSLERASVKAVYDQILSDLNAAAPYLAPVPDFNTNAARVTVFALLSRVYLDMRNFTEAGRFADSTLKLQNQVLNLNNYLTVNPPPKLSNPEVIFSKTVSPGNALPVSNSMIAVFNDTADLRYKLYTRKGAEAGVNFTSRAYYGHRLINQGVYLGPSVPEIMLIKAETEARAGSAINAITILNTLRKNRFKPADYKDITVTTSAVALQEVILERRRELMGTGRRWFDQRRLAKDGFTATVTRAFKGVTYTLQPEGKRYVFAIADKYIQLNPEIEQNPR